MFSREGEVVAGSPTRLCLVCDPKCTSQGRVRGGSSFTSLDPASQQAILGYHRVGSWPAWGCSASVLNLLWQECWEGLGLPFMGAFHGQIVIFQNLIMLFSQMEEVPRKLLARMKLKELTHEEVQSSPYLCGNPTRVLVEGKSWPLTGRMRTVPGMGVVVLNWGWFCSAGVR